MRAAWQQWIQPASVSTLAPVATAGIEIDDRFVSAGGTAKRGALQVHYEPDKFTALRAFGDYEKVRNLGESGFRIPLPQIEFVDLLRNAQTQNVTSLDLLEGTPDFDAGRLTSIGVSVNRILTPTLSVAAKYVRTRNDADIYFKDAGGKLTVATGIAKVPFVPRDFFSAGMTWVTPQHIYLSAQAVYRSYRVFRSRQHGGLGVACGLERAGGCVLGNGRQALDLRRRGAQPRQQERTGALPGGRPIPVLGGEWPDASDHAPASEIDRETTGRRNGGDAGCACSAVAAQPDAAMAATRVQDLRRVHAGCRGRSRCDADRPCRHRRAVVSRAGDAMAVSTRQACRAGGPACRRWCAGHRVRHAVLRANYGGRGRASRRCHPQRRQCRPGENARAFRNRDES